MFFALQPFTPVPNLPDLEMTVHVSRRATTLALKYRIFAPMREIIVPAPADVPLRRVRLWEETCLECFLARKDSRGYWEINLSPSGHWNVYRFSSYREGMQEEAAFSSLPFRVGQGESAFLLDVELPLAAIINPETAVQVGLSAVLKLRGGETTHWALRHPGKEPDFHRRESFIPHL